MSNNIKYIKALNFDLDTKKLQESYPDKNWRKAYNDIERYLISKGFSHRQGSGYISNKELSERKISTIIKHMAEDLSWLGDCVKQFDVTDVASKQFSYLNMIKHNNSKARNYANNCADSITNDELDLTGQSQSRGR